MRGRLSFFSLLVAMSLFLACPLIGLAARDSGYDITSSLWAKAVLQVSTSPVTLVWKVVGTDITPSGDQVISGYFYADPNDFAYGSQYNPEVFVKIYIAQSGWCNIVFNHVTVDNVTVYSAHKYEGVAQQTGTAMLAKRLVEHQYNGVAIQTTSQVNGVLAPSSTDSGYTMTSSLWAKAVLQPAGGPVTLIWKKVGADITPSGDMVVSGYFYADPGDFAYGSEFNPEVFVKIYIAKGGWCNIAFNHLTVDNVSLYSAHNYAGSPNQSGTASLASRLVEDTYDGVKIDDISEGVSAEINTLFSQLAAVMTAKGANCTNADLEPFFATNFGVNDGLGRTDFMNQIPRVNAVYTFDSIVITGKNSVTGAFSVTCNFGLSSGNGAPGVRLTVIQEAGAWKLTGNGYKIEMEHFIFSSIRWITANGTETIKSGLAIEVKDKNNTGVKGVLITGPGLPPAGITMSDRFGTGNLYLDAPYTNYDFPSGNYGNFYELTDQAIDAIPNNVTYTVIFTDADQIEIERREISLPKKPLKAIELTAEHFPTISGIASHLLSDAHIGGTLTFNYAKPVSPSLATSYMAGSLNIWGLGRYEEAFYDISGQSFETTAVSITTSLPEGWTPSTGCLRIGTSDQYGRTYGLRWVFYDHIWALPYTINSAVIPTGKTIDFSTGAIGSTGDMSYNASGGSAASTCAGFSGGGISGNYGDTFLNYLASQSVFPSNADWWGCETVYDLNISFDARGMLSRWVKTTEGKYAIVFVEGADANALTIKWVYPYGNFSWK